jgi:catechol 2,3-dioxygenase-like lactoylglutathione lyase family enzyme
MTVTKLPARLPTRLHHYAYVVRDQEKARQFVEDVLGIPLVATWTERKFFGDIGEEHDYCHTFYELEGGGALAFFQFADPKMFDRCRPAVAAEIGRFQHIALRVDESRFDDIKARLASAGVPSREVEHGYCRSLYTRMDDGFELEFTLDPPDADEIWAARHASAHSDLKRWLSGDRAINNDIRDH